MKVKRGVGEKCIQGVLWSLLLGDAPSRPGQHGHFNMMEGNFEKDERIKAAEEKEKPGPGRI